MITILFLLALMGSKTKKGMAQLRIISAKKRVFLIAGQYIEYYLHIMPVVVGTVKFGIIEIGSFIGFSGLFIYVVVSNLGKRKLIAKNHPYLSESLDHHF